MFPNRVPKQGSQQANRVLNSFNRVPKQGSQQNPQEIFQQSSQRIFSPTAQSLGSSAVSKCFGACRGSFRLDASRFPTRSPTNSRFRVSGFKFPTRFRIGVSRFPTGLPIGSKCRVLCLRFPTKFGYGALELRFPAWRYGSRIADRVPDAVPNKRFWKNSRSVPNVVHNKLPGQLGCEFWVCERVRTGGSQQG